jgi:hypothetical protein
MGVVGLVLATLVEIGLISPIGHIGPACASRSYSGSAISFFTMAMAEVIPLAPCQKR